MESQTIIKLHSDPNNSWIAKLQFKCLFVEKDKNLIFYTISFLGIFGLFIDIASMTKSNDDNS